MKADRIAELRALVAAERAASSDRKASREAWEAHRRAEAAMLDVLDEDAEALIDCAEALPLTLNALDRALEVGSHLMNSKHHAEAHAAIRLAQAALDRLNGADHD